jgi:hypothetical protein
MKSDRCNIRDTQPKEATWENEWRPNAFESV